MIIQCSACHKSETESPFSKRQRKKALQGGTRGGAEEDPPHNAKCKACIDAAATTTGQRLEQKDSSLQHHPPPLEEKVHEASSPSSSGIAAAAPGGDDENTRTPFLLTDRIPRRRRPEAAVNLHTTNTSSDDDDDDDDEPETSLDAIKRQVLGRPFQAETPQTTTPGPDEELQQVYQLMRVHQPSNHHGTPTDTASTPSSNLQAQQQPPLERITSALLPELTCPICRDIFWPPTTLPCGHSFCIDCLTWWTEKSTTTTSSSTSTCPSCRQVISNKKTNNHKFAPNQALQQCCKALFPHDVARKLEARQRNTKGERGGAHSKGYEVLSPLHEEDWHSIKITRTTRMHSTSTANNPSSSMIQTRRNIVLDADDQRMQLALALYHAPTFSPITGPRGGGGGGGHRLVVHLCLLCMEEDEATDSGFATLVDQHNVEDEHFICTQESRFGHSHWQVSSSNSSSSSILQPMARVLPTIRPPGIVEIVVGDEEEDRRLILPGDDGNSSILTITHEDTGASLQMDITSLQNRATGGDGGGQQVVQMDDYEEDDDDDTRGEDLLYHRTISYDSTARSRSSALVYDQMDRDDEEDEDDENEFEDDGFLVNEDDDEDDDDNDACQVCGTDNGSILMICDGGRHMEGCGRSYHAACVHRSSIPEGDWICTECAQSGGIATENDRGHEFAVIASRKVVGLALQDDDDSDDDDEEVAFVGSTKNNHQKKNKRRRVLEDSDEDDDSN